MSIFDAFRSPPATPAAVPAVPGAPVVPPVPAATITQPGNLPAEQPPGTVDPLVPGAPAAEPAEPSNPLDKFSDLWEPVTIKDGEEPAADFVPLDATKLQEVVSKATFTNTLTPEDMQAIAGGGEGAVEAFQKSMNVVAQQVMMQSTLAANKMTEQAVTRALKNQAAKFPELLRTQTSLDANPLFSNPAIKPVMEAVQSQLAAKNPNATAAELATMAESFVTTMGEAFTPKVTTDPNAPGADEDWGKFFT